MADTQWATLVRELERRDRLGLRAAFWLRDDDAIAPSTALKRLTGMTERFQVPLALAIIPAATGPDLRDDLADLPLVSPVVHGWSHSNHAGPDQKKQELGDHRPIAEVRSDLRRGLARLRGLYGDRLLPMLVPPWNRITPALLPELRDIGFTGLSAFGPAFPDCPVPVANTHVDIIDWRGSRGGRDSGELIDELIGALDAKRPVGVLTHHLVHDAAAWDFLEGLLAHTPGRWLTAQQALQCAQAD